MAVGKPASKAARQEALGSPESERLLVQAAQNDPSRFAELYDKHFERVYAFVARRVRNRDLAEDLTSDVFHKTLAALPRFDWRGIPFAVWLLRIAANVVTDQWKQAAKEVSDDSHEPVVDVTPEDVEQRAQLFRLVNQLPEDQGRVVVMRFAEGKTVREISHELGRTEGAVKQLQFRGLQSLRAHFGEKFGGKNG